MKKTAKLLASALIATVLIVGIPAMAFAEAPVDEADIYGDDALTVANIENSPAVRTDAVTTDIIIDEDEDMENVTIYEDEDETPNTTNSPVNTSPNTGAVSMALPVGTALLALGTMASLLKRK